METLQQRIRCVFTDPPVEAKYSFPCPRDVKFNKELHGSFIKESVYLATA